MKGSLLISIAALTIACGGESRPDDTVMEGAGQPTTSVQAGSDASAPSETEQTVTLVGCLAGPGPAPAGATGTAGSQTGAAAGSVEPEPRLADSYLLRNAIAESPGVGTGGAGASGGPLVAGKSTFALDGIPDGARSDVDKHVRIIGQLEARPAKVGVASPTTGEEYRRLTVQSVEVLAQSCTQ